MPPAMRGSETSGVTISPNETTFSRPHTMWRYREMLPVRRPENVVSLGEIVTPLISLPRIAGGIETSGVTISPNETTFFARGRSILRRTRQAGERRPRW